ncbi:MAG: hypothetical protein GY730_03645 [bacterium]|nr:hypothetical protein [bacterium]
MKQRIQDMKKRLKKNITKNANSFSSLRAGSNCFAKDSNLQVYKEKFKSLFKKNVKRVLVVNNPKNNKHTYCLAVQKDSIEYREAIKNVIKVIKQDLLSGEVTVDGKIDNDSGASKIFEILTNVTEELKRKRALISKH